MNLFKKKFLIYKKGPLSFFNDLERFMMKPGYICVLSVHGFSYSLINEIFSEALNNSLANLPDGMPVKLYASFETSSHVERIYGPDLMVDILNNFNNFKNRKVFFLGGNEHVRIKMIDKINTIYPNISVVGFDTGFIDIDAPNNLLINSINKHNPDIVFIGLGCPKQELWMYKNYKKINSLLIGVGAAFDFFAETKKQAPKWLQNIYLEWAFRLSQEPRRLFMRYFKYNSIFLIHTLARLIAYLFNKIKFKTKL